MKTFAKLLAICLTAISLLACQDAPPQVDFKAVDWKRQRFLNLELDTQTLTYTDTTFDSDLSKLHGDFCAKGKKVAELIAWARRNKERCK